MTQPEIDAPTTAGLTPLAIMRYLDLVVLALALPVFIVADLPLIAWAVVAVVWIAQRAAQAYTNRRARQAQDAHTFVGLLAGSMLARGFVVAMAVFLVGLNDNTAGLSAALLVVTLFTVYFITSMVTRPFETPATLSTARATRRPGSGRPRANGPTP